MCSIFHSWILILRSYSSWSAVAKGAVLIGGGDDSLRPPPSSARARHGQLHKLDSGPVQCSSRYYTILVVCRAPIAYKLDVPTVKVRQNDGGGHGRQYQQGFLAQHYGKQIPSILTCPIRGLSVRLYINFCSSIAGDSSLCKITSPLFPVLLNYRPDWTAPSLRPTCHGSPGFLMDDHCQCSRRCSLIG